MRALRGFESLPLRQIQKREMSWVADFSQLNLGFRAFYLPGVERQGVKEVGPNLSCEARLERLESDENAIRS